MSAFLILLSTDHCSLCEEALSMLLSMPELAGVELRVVDVASDDSLVRRYGERLPVLQLMAGQSEPQLVLEWPFSPATVCGAIATLPGAS